MEYKKSKAVIFANIVLNITATIFILAIFYLWYKSASYSTPVNLKLLVISIAGLLFSIIARFFLKNWKVNIAIAIFSTIIATYSVEFVLFDRSMSMGKIDKRTRLEVLDGLRTEGVDAWLVIMPTHFVEENGLSSFTNTIFPLGGISNKTVVYCKEEGPFSILNNDEHGFNNPKGLYQKGAVTTFLIGDSFVHGACVKSREDIASHLQSAGIKALNLGSSGNEPLIELALLKEYAEPFRPDIESWPGKTGQ